MGFALFFLKDTDIACEIFGIPECCLQ